MSEPYWRNYQQDPRAKIMMKDWRRRTFEEQKAMVAYQKEMRAAANAVRQAIKKRSLKPVKECSCVECGNQAQQYHHYKGYAKENHLHVVPTCYGCHRWLHSIAR